MVIWDLPLRLFHWSFMSCVFGAIISGKMNEWSVHERFGLAIMGLVLFRIIWGFVGSDTARFSNFLTGPKKSFLLFVIYCKKHQRIEQAIAQLAVMPQWPCCSFP